MNFTAADGKADMLHRRDALLQLGSLAGGALTLPGLLQQERLLAASSRGKSAKSCIFLFMWGGQPQQDMWDMKPESPVGARSLFGTADTVAPGITICDQMPQIARHTDKLSIVRSLNHTETDHGIGVHYALTGRNMVPPRTFPANARQRSDFPSVAGMFSYLGGPSPVPASFSIPRPVAHDGVLYAGTHGGYLGSIHDSVELGKVFNHVEVGPRANADLATVPLSLPQTVSDVRFDARRSLLSRLEAQDRAMQNSGNLQAYQGVAEDAYRLLHSTAVKEALDLEHEAPALRDRYGRHEYGESFLTARRLIEAGVRLVTVNWMVITPAAKVYNAWDAHGGIGDLEHAMTGYGMLKANYCIPSFDQAFSALLEDLSQSGLLDETVVACVGEFGRTPQINGNTGRDHWPFCYSGVLAGGGITGGSIHGESDKLAAYVKSDPVTPGDYLATTLAACGLNPNQEVHDLQGRPYSICNGQPISAILA